MFEIRCTWWLAENTGHKNYAKNRHRLTITQIWQAIYSQLRHVSAIGEKIVKQHLHKSSQCGELRPTNNRDWLASLRQPSKFQRVSHLGFVSAPMLLNGGQTNCARCLAVFCTSTLYIYIFGGCCPLTEFCQVQNSLCSKSCVLLYIQRYCKPLEHGVSSKPCGVVQGMKLQSFHSSSFSPEGATYIPRAAITLCIGPHSSKCICCEQVYYANGAQVC